jgi:predicted dehydrogenase
MIKLGIVGTGNMGRSHAEAYAACKGAKVIAVCDVSEERARGFALLHGIPQVYTDYRKMLKESGVDGISNVTPDAMHAEISIAAMKHGAHVLCEKPLASNLKEAERMAKVAGETGVINMVNLSKRNSSGLQKARDAIRAGKIGELRHVDGHYLQSWLGGIDWTKDVRHGAVWRLSKKFGSAGVLGDLGVHIYDMAMFLCGDITEISCRLENFKKPVPNNRYKGVLLDANDSFAANVKFASGAFGTIHSSRWATGVPNREFITVYGDKGAIEVNFNRGAESYFLYTRKRKSTGWEKWKEVKCGRTPSSYERFVTSIRTGKNDECDFQAGLRAQKALHYSFESDAKNRPMKIR